jgi:hypothetical protein
MDLRSFEHFRKSGGATAQHSLEIKEIPVGITVTFFGVTEDP